MEEKNRIVIDLKALILILIVFLVLIITIIVLSINVINKSLLIKENNIIKSNIENEEEKNEMADNIIKKSGIFPDNSTENSTTENMNNVIDEKEYPLRETIEIKQHYGDEYYIIKDEYKGEYDLQYISNNQKILSLMDECSQELIDYNKYIELCSKLKIKQKYTDSNFKYLFIFYKNINGNSMNAQLAAVTYENSCMNVYIQDEESNDEYNSNKAYVIVIPTKKKISTISTKSAYTVSQFNRIIEEDEVNKKMPEAIILKPIIYLYPTRKTNVSVKLLRDDLISCSYPKYKNKWEVIANHNGDLVYKHSGRKLYSLYYESVDEYKYTIQDDGFIVKGEDSIDFLEEKLARLGLSEREAEEFIVYWLPKLECNKYNYVRFATKEEIEKNMPIEIKPMPDSFIRVLMTYKGLEKPIQVKEQEIVTPKRKGFVAVEWGGTQIN
ncbi:MAG: hypothetical protein IKG56_02080 [Clostridia bacterium]|nr:hypothetical protein [Clostridia bacterium]